MGPGGAGDGGRSWWGCAGFAFAWRWLPRCCWLAAVPPPTGRALPCSRSARRRSRLVSRSRSGPPAAIISIRHSSHLVRSARSRCSLIMGFLVKTLRFLQDHSRVYTVDLRCASGQRSSAELTVLDSHDRPDRHHGPDTGGGEMAASTGPKLALGGGLLAIIAGVGLAGVDVAPPGVDARVEPRARAGRPDDTVEISPWPVFDAAATHGQLRPADGTDPSPRWCRPDTSHPAGCPPAAPHVASAGRAGGGRFRATTATRSRRAGIPAPTRSACGR